MSLKDLWNRKWKCLVGGYIVGDRLEIGKPYLEV